MRHQLVAWTAGSVSARVPGEDLVVIETSGVDHEDLSWEVVVVCDLGGDLVDGLRAPSSDTAAHAHVHRELPEGGQVHTRSPCATAWAARGEAIPCVLTAMADEIGGPVPVGPFAVIGDDAIGRGVVATLAGQRSRAVLVQDHGSSTVGASALAAVKSAVWVEDVARTVHLARQPGDPLPVPQDAIDALHDRYQHVHGQR